MRGWRLVNKRFAAEAFSGEGAKAVGGRWNSIGTAVVYASENLSLAALELFIWLSEADKTEEFLVIPFDIPKDLVVAFPLSSLPRHWRAPDPVQETMEIGDAWVRSGDSAIFKVPSVVIPAEFNLILNPAHPEFKRLVIHPAESFTFDPRLWKNSTPSK